MLESVKWEQQAFGRRAAELYWRSVFVPKHQNKSQALCHPDKCWRTSIMMRFYPPGLMLLCTQTWTIVSWMSVNSSLFQTCAAFHRSDGNWMPVLNEHFRWFSVTFCNSSLTGTKRLTLTYRFQLVSVGILERNLKPVMTRWGSAEYFSLFLNDKN